ncbi:MAG: Flp pilus assembly protein CpaB [Actinomycetota bacterium]|nr:Flp pilus assembly protein CpaB [Actinomycetota bacterium]MDH4352824.1 Flp pilus assembly protein CpaB [Actinomycetota bacterium]
MGRRTVLLIAALVVAALGTAMVFIYINNYTAAEDEGAQFKTVLIATDTIPAGTTSEAASEAGSFETQEWQEETIPPGAVSDPAAISGLVALAPVFPGQAILTQMFGPPGGAGGGLAIPKDELAVAVELGDPNRVAGFVAPGSEVAVFVTLEDAAGNQKTQLLLARSSVIAVGPTTVSTVTTTETTGDQNVEEISRAILTLALSQQDSQKIIYAQSQGDLYFGLLNDSSQVRPSKPTNSGNLFGR